MRGKSKYLIEFGGLIDGIHEFEFHIDDSFFSNFENSIVQKGDIDILVTLEKQPGVLLVDFTLSGTVITTCDRCLEDLDLDIEAYNEMVVKLSHAENAEEASENDVFILSPKEHELDVADLMYEYITLQIPFRNIHPEDEGGISTCNPEALKEMEKYITHEHHDDPRWEVLKNINLN